MFNRMVYVTALFTCFITLPNIPVYASTKIEICSQIPYPVNIAYAYLPENKDQWEVIGWWKRNPGECLNLTPSQSNYYYLHATGQDSNWQNEEIREGDENATLICVPPQPVDDLERPTQRCPNRNIKKVFTRFIMSDEKHRETLVLNNNVISLKSKIVEQDLISVKLGNKKQDSITLKNHEIDKKNIHANHTNHVNNIFIAALTIPLVNGVFLDWGDDFYCKVFSQNKTEEKYCNKLAATTINEAFSQYPKVSTASMVIGMFLSPIGFFAVFFSRTKTPSKAFQLGFNAELIEGIISATGEYSTFGKIDSPETFVQFTLAAMFVMGILAATIKAWETSVAFRLLVPITIMGLIVIAIYNY